MAEREHRSGVSRLRNTPRSSFIEQVGWKSNAQTIKTPRPGSLGELTVKIDNKEYTYPDEPFKEFRAITENKSAGKEYNKNVKL